MSLDQKVIDRSLAVNADDVEHSTSRVVINGAVVIYDMDDPPAWLLPVLYARDDDGNVPDRPTTFVNYNQTVLVTAHPNGTLSVALRSDRDAIWGPPISVGPEG